MYDVLECWKNEFKRKEKNLYLRGNNINNKKISSIAFTVNKKATSPRVAMVAILRKISESL